MSINQENPSNSSKNIVSFPMTVIINAAEQEASQLEDELNQEVGSGEIVRPVHVIGKTALIKTSHHPSAYYRNK
jgi:hypothetical protein